jgi:hypothetical protein
MKMYTSRHSVDPVSETFFSSADFAEAWAQSLGAAYRAVALLVEGSGPDRTMHAIQRVDSFGRNYNFLAPDGLYSSPAWKGRLEQATVSRVLDKLMTAQSASFEWNVRFDHSPLAAELISLGCSFDRTETSVLYLTKEYDRIFSSYNTSIRNHIRKGYRRGLVVRRSQSREDLRTYYLIHKRRAEEKGGYSFILPFELLASLIEISGVTLFLLAEYKGRAIAGGIFLRDGCSVFYFHGAFDSSYSNLYPSCVILDEAIRGACHVGADFFNLGGSNGIVSLDRFKSFWGAKHELNWRFQWKNPFWDRLSRLKLVAKEIFNGR